MTDDCSDLAADPMPSFDQEENEEVMESEMDDDQEDDSLPPAPAESPRYEEFQQDRETSVSPQKSKPKSILRSKRNKSSPHTDDDDDSLFDFEGKNSALGKGTSVRKSSLKSGVTSNSSTRKGRRPRRRSEEDGNDDDESLIQYGEHRQRSSSLQERTQEAWTFRSKRSFSASSPRKEEPQQAGVQFGNTDTIHHFDDQETVGTTGTFHSINSMYTKSPESEVEDLIKDLLLIGSGEHSNPGRRKLKYQPVYKRQLRKKGDDRSIDDNTLGTTDISLNTLEYSAAHPEFSSAAPKARGKGLEADAPRKGDTQSKPVGESVDSNAEGVDGEGDPLSMVWGYVESGMKALGLASVPPKPNETEAETEHTEKKVPKPNETEAETKHAEKKVPDVDSEYCQEHGRGGGRRHIEKSIYERGSPIRYEVCGG